MDKQLPRGTQIIRHTGKKGEPDEAGFVTSGPTGNGGYFCRFWNMRGGDVLAFRAPIDLRTKAVSELVLAKHIVVQDTIAQEFVTWALEKYC